MHGWKVASIFLFLSRSYLAKCYPLVFSPYELIMHRNDGTMRVREEGYILLSTITSGMRATHHSHHPMFTDYNFTFTADLLVPAWFLVPSTLSLWRLIGSSTPTSERGRAREKRTNRMDGSDNQAHESRGANSKGIREIFEGLPGGMAWLAFSRFESVPRVIHHARLSFENAVGDVVAAVDGEKSRSAKAARKFCATAAPFHFTRLGSEARNVIWCFYMRCARKLAFSR